jgi:esterase/lipase
MSDSSSHVENPVGIAILAHGLNNPPHLLSPLSRLLAGHSILSHQVTLAGHEIDNPRTASANDWVNDIVSAFDLVKKKHPTLPIYNVSYSLGALATVAAMNKTPLDFSKMVFWAPAVQLRLSSQMTRLLLPLASFGLALPSLTPSPYRRSHSTALSEYAALFQLSDSIIRIESNRAREFPPTLVLTAARDELISPSRIRRWANDNSLEHWVFDHSDDDGYRPSHMMCDHSRERWKYWADRTISFLISGD